MTELTMFDEVVAICREGALRARQPERALGAAATLGRLLSTNATGVIEDEALEVTLFERHGQTLATAAEPVRVIAEPFDRLHVISEAFDFGGHTRILGEMAAAQAETKRTAVVVTTSATRRFAERCIADGIAVFRLTGNLVDRAAGLIALGGQADQIFLHLSPDDIGAALGARVLRESGRTVFFVNHADHLFSFGHGAATSVAEVSGFGWRLTADRRAANSQHFIGIPMTAVEAGPKRSAMPPADAPILSIGAPYKFRPNSDGDFPAFLIDVMAQTDRPVELIGPSTEDPWWQPVTERFGDRLRLLGSVSSEELPHHRNRAACYVDSFPMTGGTALTECLMAGLTVFAPPFPAGGYGLVDVLRSSSVAEMTREVLEFLLTGEEPPLQSNLRSRIASEFGPVGFRRRLARLEEGATDAPPDELLSASYDLDYYATAWRRRAVPVVRLAKTARPALRTRVRIAHTAIRAAGVQRPSSPALTAWAVVGHPESWFAKSQSIRWRLRPALSPVTSA